MSAFVVDDYHIAYLLEAALSQAICQYGSGGKFQWFGPDKEWHTLTRGNKEEVGQMLWNENVRSVAERYPDDPFELPGPVGAAPYQFEDKGYRWQIIEPAQVLKSCDCYEYQSCETDDWEDTQACAFIQALRREAIRALQRYDGAVWGAPKPVSVSKVGG